MKKIFSKKSGFTLVEIVIAFAVFAIMAAMILQILELTIKRRTANDKFEKTMQYQEQLLVAKPKDYTYDATKGDDGKLTLNFKDQDGNPIPMELFYQLHSASGEIGDASGINYLVGNIAYAEGVDGSEYIPPESGDEDDPLDPNDLGGASQMSRFDTRITGTKGISSVVVTWTYSEANDEYTFYVLPSDSSVAPVLKKNCQVSLFFGEAKAGGKLATVKSVSSSLGTKYIKQCGANGVNIHCPSDSGFNGGAVTFKVKLNEKLDSLGFGDNNTFSANSYTAYNDGTLTYANIFGAYKKTS